MKKSPKKTSKSSSKEDKVSAYVTALDLRSMWEDFSMSTNDNGTLQFKTVWQFICKQTKVDWQRDLLYWMLGPKIKAGDPASPYKDYEQLDFMTRRNHGHWATSENIESLSKEINNKHHAFEKIQRLGDININVISRLQTMMEQLDREFGAGIFLPGYSKKENAIRATLYTTLYGKIIDMLQQVQEMYSRTQGVELKALNQFMALFASNQGGLGNTLNLFAERAVDSKTGLKSVAAQLTDMIAGKAVAYELDLPDKDMTSLILDASKGSKRK